MPVDRLKRVDELLRREIGESLFHVMNERDFDVSAVTVTKVNASHNLRDARVMISIRDHAEERQRMLGLIKRHRREIQTLINRDLVLKYTPRLHFELDFSIEKGDHILDILSRMEEEETERPEES